MTKVIDSIESQKITVVNSWLIVVDNAISHELCDSIIEDSKFKLKASGILGAQIDKYRTSSDYFLNSETEYDKVLSSVVREWTSIPIENFENASVISYAINQQYKEHYDFLHHIKGETKQAGDRIFTAVFYLNDDFSGGETSFPKLNQAIVPKKGRLVIWKNYINGLPNYDSLHAGLEVRSGCKWIATKWVRERAFTNLNKGITTSSENLQY